MRSSASGPGPIWNSGSGTPLRWTIELACKRAIAVLIAVVLASCAAPLGRNAGDDLILSAGRTAPGIVIGDISGVPRDRLVEVEAAFRKAGWDFNLDFSGREATGQDLILTGRFDAAAAGDNVAVRYQVFLVDADGGLVHSFAGNEEGGLLLGRDPWAAVTPPVFDRIALESGESIARRLKQLKFATAEPALQRPPSKYFAEAGLGAEREVDFETLNGQPQPPDPLPGGEYIQSREAALPAQSQAPLVQPRKPPDAKAATVSAVAVLAIADTPEAKSSELAIALRRVIAGADWQVVGEPQPNAISIAGQVDILEPRDGRQVVVVLWTIASPTGTPLGEIKMSNTVPAGSLAKGWGDAATAVAENAAVALFDLVNHYR